ncbi:MAG: cation diffusion facilitator family transporter [Microbacteriaceae bacterium]
MSAHQHDHSAGVTNRTRLWIAISIIGVFLMVEIVGAALSGSLALLADAGHMFSDVLGLVIALVALGIAARPPTDRQTFGYQRAEVLGALANGLLIGGIAVFVAIEGIGRLVAPTDAEVLGVPMLLVAAAGLVANVAALLVLRGGALDSIGLRGAYLEVLGDLFGSIAAIIAGIVIVTTGFIQADAIASLVIAGLIVPRAFVLLRDVVRILSQATPANTDVQEIRDHILGAAGVVDVHDVHVWALTSGNPVFTAHVVVEQAFFASGGTGALLDELTVCLAEHFDVEHSTFQIEPVEHAAHEEPYHR